MEEQYYDAAAGFNNYDAGDNYDADNAIGKAVARMGTTRRQVSPSKGIIGSNTYTLNIAVQSTSLNHNIQLFNSMFSISKIADNSLASGLTPLLAGRTNVLRNGAGDGTAQLVGYAAIVSNSTDASIKKDVVYWLEDGSLIYNYNTNGDSGNIVISCKEVPYRSLLEYSGVQVMRIRKIRATYSDVNQITNDMRITHRTILGVKNQNTISPSTYKSPIQFQSNIVDIDAPFTIDAQRGIEMQMNSGTQTVSMVMVTDWLGTWDGR